MIIWGGEPPVVENPEPRFGEVILKLNAVVEAVRAATDSLNGGIEEKLSSISENIGDFITTVSDPITAHINAVGTPQHGESLLSIGLGKKDNFRTATVAETVAFAPVQAFVTPQGGAAAIENNVASFVPGNYQQNDLFQFGSFYYPDEYPTVTPGRVEPIRYLGNSKITGVLFNDDRLIYSPYSDPDQYQNNLLFNSLPTGKLKGGRLAEIQNVSDRFLTAGWNTMGCDTTSGGVAFFKALADKKIYLFNNTLQLPAGNRNYLLYDTYSTLSYKGLAISSSYSGTTVTLNHRFFYAANVATNPTLTELLDSSYQATFSRLDTPPYQAPATGSQTFDLMSYVNLPSGTTLSIGGGSHGVVTSLFWNVQDMEMYLHVAVPVIVTLGGVTRQLVFSFIESIKPGSLSTGGTASFTQLGVQAKDTLDLTLLPVGTPNWFSDGNPYNLLNPVQYPGVLLSDSGEIVKSISGKYGVKVKRYPTGFTSVGDWLTSAPQTIDPKAATRELYCPSRHACFGLMPERIIPFAHSVNGLSYLVYGQDPLNGRFVWRTHNWFTPSPVSTEISGHFGLRLPDVVTDVSNIVNFPPSLLLYTSKVVAGVTLDAMVFNENNSYTSFSGFGYDGTTITPGTSVTLDQASLLKLKALGGDFLTRAAVANPSVNPGFRSSYIQVSRLTGTKALVTFSDGVSYAEAGIANWSLVGASFVLDNSNTGGALLLYTVTPSRQGVVSGNRSSMSGDDVWLPYGDVLVSAADGDTFDVVLTRAFGTDVYGDASFHISGGTTATPTFTPVSINPARLYAGTDAFDTVDELYPAILIPQKGVYQYNSSNTQFSTMMNEVGGTGTIDPFDINETGWVRLPAGSRLVLNGRTIILDKDYAVAAGTTGTVYCYLQLMGAALTALASPVYREPSNNEVLFGTVTNGILVMTKSYIVMNGRVISATRHGAAIPCFLDDGGKGVNQFFTSRDVG